MRSNHSRTVRALLGLALAAPGCVLPELHDVSGAAGTAGTGAPSNGGSLSSGGTVSNSLPAGISGHSAVGGSAGLGSTLGISSGGATLTTSVNAGGTSAGGSATAASGGMTSSSAAGDASTLATAATTIAGASSDGGATAGGGGTAATVTLPETGGTAGSGGANPTGGVGPGGTSSTLVQAGGGSTSEQGGMTSSIGGTTSSIGGTTSSVGGTTSSVGGTTSNQGGTLGTGGVSSAAGTSSTGGSPSTGGSSAFDCHGSDGVIAQLNASCTEEGKYACLGYNTIQRAYCTGGTWKQASPCDSVHQRCDTNPGSSAGTCQNMNPFCSAPCAMWCFEASLVTCGPDRITAKTTAVCPGACSSTGCVAPETLASALSKPSALAKDANSLYWVHGPAGDLSAATVPLTGGATTTFGSPSGDVAVSAAVDSTHYYFVYFTIVRWVSSGPSSTRPVYGTLLGAVALANGTFSKPVTSSEAMGAVTVDANYVYWATDQAIVKHDPATGDNTTLASGQSKPTALVVDGTNAYWANAGNGSVGTATVMTVPLNGGDVVQLAGGQTAPVGIAVDSQNVYWANAFADDGRIMAVPIAGGDVTQLAKGSLPKGIAVQSNVVYFTDSGDGTVMKVSASGGSPSTVASSQSNPTSIVVDANTLYWMNAGTGTDGSVMRLRLK